MRDALGRACRLGNALLGLGCHPGDRVAVLLPNCAQYLEVELGLALAGLVRVSLNVRLPEPDLRAILEDAEPAALLFAERYDETAGALMAASAAPRAVRLAERGSAGPGHDYEGLLADGRARLPSMAVEDEAPYCIFYTSGTTGRPKGVVLSRHAQLAVAYGLLLEFGPVRRGESVLLLQPLSHGAGFFMLPYFLSGAASVVEERFDPEASLSVAGRHGVQTIKATPTMLISFLESGAAVDLPRLRRIIYGGSPIPLGALQRSIEMFGPVLAQLYGQAEAPMCITVLPEEDHVLDDEELLSSAGRPWRNVEVRIIDADGASCGPGEVGEVIVRAPQTMTGYWHRPEETAATLRNDYLHTRDLGLLDERGYLHLLGRSDDVIISGGFNIASRRVEEVLQQHPSVLEAAVVGAPDPYWGEIVTAFVVLNRDAEAAPDELIDFCRGELAFQRPRRIEIVPQLPKNAYGKVLKTELRDRAARPAA